MDSSAVQDIKSRLNIVDVVGGYLKLSKSGTHWKANCPFHNEKTPSFTVNEERQIFHCFGCGKGGDMFSFVEEMEGVDFKEALKLLAEKAGVELPKYRKESVFSPGGMEEPDRTKEVLELATKFYEKQLWDGEGKKTALPYLRKRGLSDESIRLFRLGYAPEGWRHVFDFFLSRGYRADELEKAGLVIRSANRGQESGSGEARYYDRFRDRIMFPISDVVGRVIGYSARVAPGGDESQAKYINTPETLVYHKSRALYGLYQAKQSMKEKGFSVLVEGNMDVIACHQSGIGNAVAVSGTALTTEQLDILKRYGRETRLFFDMDGAGQAAAWKSALLAFEKEMTVSIIALPHGKDAADAALEDPAMLLNATEQAIPAARYFLNKLCAENDLKTAEGKRGTAEKYAPLLLAMRSSIDQGFWRKELADAIGVEEKALTGVLQNAYREQTRVAPEVSETKVVEKDSFTRRAEVLRDRLFGLLLLDGGLVGAEQGVPERVERFLSADPIYPVIRSFAGADVFSGMPDDDMKQRGAELLFEAEKLAEGKDDDASEGELRARVFSQLLSDLLSELLKEDRTDIVRALGEAKKSGDRELEKKLMERFSELSKLSH